MSEPLCIMLVAAEPSGDALGAGLMRALAARLGRGVRFVGVGGPAMRAEGLDSLFDIADLAIWGWAEGIKAYPRVIDRAERTAALAGREKPAAAILIDSWGFTLRVAQRIRRASPQTVLVKYVAPQVWATRRGRAKTLAQTFDHLLSILSFDAPYFEEHGLPVTRVGNPHLRRSFEGADPARLRSGLGIGPDEPILLILPGSRPSEVARLMGPFGETVARLKAARPGLQLVLAAAPTVADAIKAEAAHWAVQPHIVEGEEAKFDAMKAAEAALACSGTVTTELALAGCPMVVAYKVSALTAALIRMVIKVQLATLFNIAAGRAVAPELIQENCTPEKLVAALAPLLDDPQARARQAVEQDEALALLGSRNEPAPSEIAADAVIALIEKARA